MATQTRNPTNDIVATGAWTGVAGQRWQLVDDFPDTVPVDTIRHGNAAGHIKFGFPALAIPAGSTAISVQVLYYDHKTGGAACAVAGSLRLGSTPTDHNAATHNPGNGIANLALRTDNFATNPKSGAAWTVNDINGVGTNFLVGFGLFSSDANPNIVVTSVQLQITYTPPAITFTKTGTGIRGHVGSGVSVKIAAPPQPPTNLRKL